MFEINLMLLHIMEKYNIEPFNHDLYKSFFKEISLSLIQENLSGKRVAIRCCGNYMYDFLNNLGEHINIVAIFDRQPRHLSLSCGEFDVQMPESMNKLDFDVVLIASVEYADAIAQECREKDFPYWSIYIALKKYGVVFPRPECYFYSFDFLADASMIPIYAIMLQVISIHIPSVKEKATSILISHLFYMKDLCYLKQILCNICAEPLASLSTAGWCEGVEYSEDLLSNHAWYQALLNDLTNLELSIKNALSKRTHHDYFCFWLDALSLDLIEKANYLFQTKAKSYNFTRAYTTTPSTFSVMRSMFYKLWDLEDNSLIINEDAPAYTLFKDNKIDSHYFGVGHHLFDNLQRMDERRFRHDRDLKEENDQEKKLTECFWSSFEQLFSSKNAQFIMVHTYRETHGPYITPNILDWKSFETMTHLSYATQPEEILKQRIQALEYYDKELAWFCSLMPENQTRIYFSDHGSLTNKTNCIWDENLIHVNLFIDSPSLPAHQEDRLFSYINFYELLDWLINSNTEDNSHVFSDVVCIQSRDYYNKKFVEQIVEHGCQKNYMAYRGAIGKSDKFIRLGNGQEMYFFLPDEKTNYIHEPAYQSRIQELRDIAGNYFIDIYHDEKYRYSRMLYQ